MTGPAPEIRQLHCGDDLGPELQLRREAFGPVVESEVPAWLVEAEASVTAGQQLGAFYGKQLVGSARLLDMRQWWHGAAVAMAGVSGVKVAAEQRGRGIGTALMNGALTAIAERGYPLAVLYPYTAPIYRSLGWELAGGRQEATLPARSLRGLLPPDACCAARPAAAAGDQGSAGAGAGASASASAAPATVLRRAGPDDAAAVIAATGAAHQAARHCGPATRDAATVRRWLGDPHLFAYLAPDGFLACRWHDGASELFVQWAVAGSASTTRAIWAVVASHSSVVAQVRVLLTPHDPLGWLLREPDADLVHCEPWMLRVVAAAAAVAARGFPAAVRVSQLLSLDDPRLPANSGLWRLEVSGGSGVLHPAGGRPGAEVPLTLGARGFAALYAGTPLPTLRLAGLAAGGDPAADAALDCAFAGLAFMLDAF